MWPLNSASEMLLCPPVVLLACCIYIYIYIFIYIYIYVVFFPFRSMAWVLFWWTIWVLGRKPSPYFLVCPHHGRSATEVSEDRKSAVVDSSVLVPVLSYQGNLFV